MKYQTSTAPSQSQQYSRKSLWPIHAMMLLCAGLVSTSFTVSKAITDAMDPAVLTLLRFAIAALLFLPYIHRKYGLRLPDKKSLLGYACISFTLTGFFWLMFLSMRTTTALNTGVIFTLVPGISGLYSAILLKERLGRHRLTAMLPATLGAIWVIFRGSLSELLAFNLNPGDLLFFASCLLMAFYMPLVKFFHRDEPMSLMTFWILVTGTGWLLLFCGHQLPSLPWTSVPLKVWSGIIYLATFSTIITFFLSQFCTLILGPTRVMAYSYLYPPFIVLIEWGLGHPLPSARILPGVGLIIAAMFIVQQGAEEKRKGTGGDQKEAERRNSANRTGHRGIH
ncbi:MAG: DMT family transporter [Candidatus Electrothrix aestuarii]|uniref:DMT family transporter n=1 Tax=Candidatus Electrothrix aestuarii TaxID=3062594 RepID=A0AAU8LRH9_9BACT|nr:DMT family transporter [Candidatus Electrothrix aestuarii]